MKVRLSVTVHGRVQGVAFRHYACQKALVLGVTGWVRNLPDNSVEGLFEGDAAAVQGLVEWCRNGPPLAEVERLEIREGSYSGEFETFSIRS